MLLIFPLLKHHQQRFLEPCIHGGCWVKAHLHKLLHLGVTLPVSYTHLDVYKRQVLPMGRPIIATVALFSGIAYWNDWYNGMIYLTKSELFSIQNLLNRMLADIQFLSTNAAMRCV